MYLDKIKDTKFNSSLTKDILRSGFAPEYLMFYISALLLSYLGFFSKNDKLKPPPQFNTFNLYFFFKKKRIFHLIKQNGALRSSVKCWFDDNYIH